MRTPSASCSTTSQWQARASYSLQASVSDNVPFANQRLNKLSEWGLPAGLAQHARPDAARGGRPKIGLLFVAQPQPCRARPCSARSFAESSRAKWLSALRRRAPAGDRYHIDALTDGRHDGRTGDEPSSPGSGHERKPELALAGDAAEWLKGKTLRLCRPTVARWIELPRTPGGGLNGFPFVHLSYSAVLSSSGASVHSPTVIRVWVVAGVIVVAPARFTATMAAACPSCVFGATASSSLSFTYHAIETITVSVIPHVTVYTNGTEKTSFQRITETNTAWAGSGSNSSVAKTFTNTNDITWTVGDATLTYPTTYIQYLGFEGAPITSTTGDTCSAPTDIPAVDLPSSTDVASFIFPLQANATAGMPLPTPLLDYLAQLPEVSAQFNGEPLTGCAPLTWTGPASASASPSSEPAGSGSSAPLPQTPSTSSASASSSSSAYHAPIQSSSRPGNYSSPLTTRSRPGQPSSSTSTTTALQVSTSPSLPGQSSQTPYSSASAVPPPPPPGTTSSYPAASASSGPQTYQSSEQTQTTVETGTLTHTTAFVIKPITGPTTYTTISAPDADHTKSPVHAPGTNSNGKTTSHETATPGIVPAEHGSGSPHPHKPTARTTRQVYTNGHQTITAGPHGGVVIGSKTVHPGHKITIGTGSSTTVVALHRGHGTTKLVMGGTTFDPVPQHGDPTPKPRVSVGVITTNGHTITAVRSGQSIILEDGSSTATLPAGGKATFEGQTISAPHHGGSIAVNGKGIPLTAGGGSQVIVTAGGHTFTAVDVGKSVVLKDGSSTIVVKDGAQTTFDGQTVSVGSSGTAVVVNGKTTMLSAIGAPMTSGSAIITAGGHTITALDKSGSVILMDATSTTIVSDGKVATFDGQKISVLPNGNAVVFNGKTLSFTSSASTTPTTTGIGGYIHSGLGGSGAKSTTSLGTNAASSVRPLSVIAWGVVFGVMSVLAIL